MVLMVILAAREAVAQPCVSRRKHSAESARDGKLENGKLVFCTSDNCWSMDPATRVFTTAPKIPRSKTKYEEPIDPTGRAKATQKGVEFCPTKDTCKQYKYKFKFEGVLWVAINDEGTLGAVTYQGDSMEDQPTWVLLYDLVKKKEIKRLKTGGADVLGTTFLVEDTLYSATAKKVGKLARDMSYSTGPVRIAKSNLIAFADKFRSTLYLVDSTTGKTVHKLDLKLPAAKGDVIDPYLIVSSADGAQVHVVSGGPNTGEVITIDTTTGKELARSAPPICK